MPWKMDPTGGASPGERGGLWVLSLKRPTPLGASFFPNNLSAEGEVPPSPRTNHLSENIFRQIQLAWEPSVLRWLVGI